MSFFEELGYILTAYWWQIIVSAVAAYLIGSVNTSIIVTRIVAHKDIRTMGSGNAGFTNVLRSVGKVPAITTFVGDFLKGVVSILIAFLLLLNCNDATIHTEVVRQYVFYIAGLFCVLGHMYPIYYGFKGGKGVVTTASVMLMTDWRVLVTALVVFVIVFVSTKVISKCALINAVCFPISTFCFRYFLDYNLSNCADKTVNLAIFASLVSLVIAIFVIYRHKDNIKRILNGTEKKITAKK